MQFCPLKDVSSWVGIPCIVAMSIYTFGLHSLFYREMAFPSHMLSRRVQSTSPNDRSLDINSEGLILGYDQWNGNITRMTKMWTIARKGCTLLVPLSLAFFQVSGVSNNIFARTTALAACLCSSTGLVASNWYLFRISTLKTRRMKAEWIKASHILNTKQSIDFWVFITLPISSLAWSIIFCLATISSVTWMNPGDISSADGETSPSVVGSAVFLTILMMGQIVQVYRAMKFFKEK